ncbi:hypothetical protein GOP47_0000531 [Adiantum capillus-veneris]|uniref:Uncharacterized protein n=1 Tax=Adiantum capillus-veneris TaxID=13818 RepID=A0A9D4VDQ5_ADICA|nr:hypothetical protein GOP47_0000531 [Adiantum capillus-veneris]
MLGHNAINSHFATLFSRNSLSKSNIQHLGSGSYWFRSLNTSSPASHFSVRLYSQEVVERGKFFLATNHKETAGLHTIYQGCVSCEGSLSAGMCTCPVTALIIPELTSTQARAKSMAVSLCVHWVCNL